MIPLDVALQAIDDRVRVINFNSETLATSDSMGRIVAEDQRSRLDLPPFNRASMDGYAILTNDYSDQFEVLEVVAAGEVATKSLRFGTAIKVMTGSPVPPNAGKIVPLENVAEQSGLVKVLENSQATNIASQGEDLKCKDLVLRAGTFIRPIEIATLVACGITELKVFRRLRVAIIATGNEIVTDLTEIKPGKIMNSNSPMLAALCQRYGFEVVNNVVVKDDCDLIASALTNAATVADIILVSGGVSVGDFDLVSKALAQAGFIIHFSRIAIKPGKPSAFASNDQQLVFGLPGNPVAAFLAFHLLALRAWRRMLNMGPVEQYILLPLAKSFSRRSSDRIEYVPCSLEPDGSVLEVAYHGSGHLAALLNCRGFFVIDQGVSKVKAGELVQFFAIPSVFVP